MALSFLKGMRTLVVLGGVVVLGSLWAQPAYAESAGGAGAAQASSGSTAGGAEAEQGGAVAEIDLNAPVPNFWPLPDGCKKMVPAGGAACDGCCRTTVNTWLSPWCWQHTKPGPERDQCNQDATNWFIWCIQDCAGAAANQSSQAQQ